MSHVRLATLLHRILILSSVAACGGRVIEEVESHEQPGEPPQDTTHRGEGNATGGSTDDSTSRDAGRLIADAGSDISTGADQDASCWVVSDGGSMGAAGVCTTSYVLQCSAPLVGSCDFLCPPTQNRCRPRSEAGAGVYECYAECGGRRPEGFTARVSRDGSPVGAFFASLAELEAASIDAFAILERELAAHGAPRRCSGRPRARHATRSGTPGSPPRSHGGTAGRRLHQRSRITRSATS